MSKISNTPNRPNRFAFTFNHGPLTLALCLLAAAPLLAQDAAPAQPPAAPAIAPVQQEVTVTATRSSLGVNPTASSIRILDQQTLLQEPGFTLDDHLRQIPGIELFRRTSSWVANPTSDGITLRGLGSTAASRSLVLSDEVPLLDPFGSWVHWNEIPTLAVKDVEVLRGGASDLYGSSAIGGVINVVPVRADEAHRSIQVNGGSLGTISTDAILSGPIARNFSALGAGSFFRTNGYTTLTPVSRGAVDINSNVISRSGRIELREGDMTRGAFLRGNVLDEARSNGTPLTVNSTRLWRYQAGADDTFGNSHVYLRLFGSDQRYRQAFSTIASNRNSESLNRLQTVLPQELGLSGQFSHLFGPVTIVAGADVHDVRANDLETTFSGGAPSGIMDTSARQRESGGYVEALLNTKHWSAALSGRIDDFRTFDVHQFLTAGPTHIANKTEDIFNPRLGIVRRLPYGISLTGDVFRAFRGPTMNELYRSSQVGQQLTKPPASGTLLSERATGFEFGVEQSGRLGKVRGSYFWTEVNNPITAVTTAQTMTSQTLVRVNLGQLRSDGISIDFTGNLRRWLSVSGGYQLALATITKFNPASIPGAVAGQPSYLGAWLPEVARNAGTLQLNLHDRRFGTLNFIGRNSGRVYDGVESISPDPILQAQRQAVLLHSFFRADLHAERTVGRWVTGSVDVQNLLDRAIDSGRTPLLALGTPRTVTVGINIHSARTP